HGLAENSDIRRAVFSPSFTRASQKPTKAVIVIGAGIAGLSCAYELVRRGHDATVVEASGRPGAYLTIHSGRAVRRYRSRTFLLSRAIRNTGDTSRNLGSAPSPIRGETT